MEQTSVLHLFLEKNKSLLLKSLDSDKIRASILTTSEEDLSKAGQLIAAGELVSFPTETVYGLGANALDESAVLKIYKAKNRPLTDPVIVHVTSFEQALGLVEISEEVKSLFKYLVDQFWPGPLTVILKADLSKIPLCVTAQTGYVGVRYPKSEVAQKLIDKSKKPIAAPSANLFSHVSPTSALHVFNDLYDKDLSIIDGENCQFGIESTVVKITESEGGSLSLFILRNGSISEKALDDCLKGNGKYAAVPLKKIKKEHTVSETENSAAPGQLLKHYSPNCETFLLNFSDEPLDEQKLIADVDLKKLAVIDFARKAEWLKGEVLAYTCISDNGLILEAMNKLYDSLRWAENIEGVRILYITNIEEAFRGKEELTEFLETIYDKIYRSSSGKKIFVRRNETKFYRL